MIGELTNHLWQSSFYAIAAGMLALALRRNRAQVRYWLWLSASLKFLVPFSLLMSLGSHLAWAPVAKTTATQAVSYTIVEVTQPFPVTLSSAPSIPHATNWLVIAVFIVWACGFGAIALIRFRDWLGIRAAVRSSRPLEIPAAVEVRSSASLLEPGVVGLLHPILLLPEGILQRLTPPQLEAVFAHELCHVRRRDNLTAALHMIVEAVFWFHPLVWWIGARLVEERELACDEEVLRLGSDPQMYPQGILNVCKFYVESPVRCVSGVTGSDLKKRIQRIMKERFGVALSARKKLLLAAAGAVVLATPVLVGALNAPRLGAQSVDDWQTKAGGKMAFDVASVKVNKSGLGNETTNVPLDPGNMYAPSGGLFTATNFRALRYISFAYKMSMVQGMNLEKQLPKWALDEKFDIQARAPGNPTKDQIRLMMQTLLADRFKLAIHTETRQLPILALVLATPGKTGPQLRPYPDGSPCAPLTRTATGAPRTSQTVAGAFPDLCGGFAMMQASAPGRLKAGGRNVNIQVMADPFSAWADYPDRPVSDRTGLTGTYDFAIEFTPHFEGPPIPGIDFQPDPSGPTFQEALREQLGLKLEPQTGPVEVFVIDHVEEPAPN